MRTRPPVRIPSRSSRRREGLTLLEMLVSTAMLAFIVLGLTAMLVQTQKAFKTGIKQNTITDAGRTIMDMITADLGQMSDAQNSNVVNFFWGLPTANGNSIIVNYENGAAIRTNALYEIYILQHTNTAWVGVGYAVSNLLTQAGTPTGVGTLYRFETNWNDSAPFLTNAYDYLCGAFFGSFSGPRFSTNYWHPLADGVIDLEIRAFDQYGNENDSVWTNQNGYFAYPILPPLNPIRLPTMTILAPSQNMVPANIFSNLPNSVELELGILEPETIAQARALAVNPAALQNFLMTNAAPKVEVFRQRVTIAAAAR